MSDKIKFPALPPRDHAFADPEGDLPDIDLWRIEKMSAYGQQCYQQALEDVARMLMAEHNGLMDEHVDALRKALGPNAEGKPTPD